MEALRGKAPDQGGHDDNRKIGRDTHTVFYVLQCLGADGKILDDRQQEDLTVRFISFYGTFFPCMSSTPLFYPSSPWSLLLAGSPSAR